MINTYPELMSLSESEAQQQVSLVYQYNRTIQLALDVLSWPRSTPRFTPWMLNPMIALVEERLNRLDQTLTGTNLSAFLKAERQRWIVNRERLLALIET